MAAGVNFLQLLDADFGVDGGGVEFLVPEQLLSEPDVGSVLRHVGRATKRAPGARSPNPILASWILILASFRFASAATPRSSPSRCLASIDR